MSEADILAAAEAFDEDNPYVWQVYDRIALQDIASGHTVGGAGDIYERMRWHVWLSTLSDEPFKLNNNHRAYYARKWLKAHPEYPGFFKLRKSRMDNGQRDDDDDDEWKNSLIL